MANELEPVNFNVNLHIARQTQLFVKINSLSPGTMAESCWESSSEEELFLTQSTFTVKSDEYDGMGVSTSEGNGKCLEDNAGISEGSGRFRAPISSDECRKFEDSWVSDASRRKWNWVLNIFEEWRETRNEAVLKVENSGEPLLNQRIDEMSDEDLDFFLGRFVAEVRKEDGQEYPGKTIYEMICSLQCYLRFQRKGPLFLIDKKGCKFRNLNSALNFVLKERAGEGIGSITSQAEVITPDQMEYLWQNDFVISGLMHLTQKVWKKGMTKLKQRGKAAKILLSLLLRRKLKSVISDGNCKLRIFLVLKIFFAVFFVVSSQ
ncbi:uncharacterized protein [Acropora muricata]|uniref:uncharacterized protein isoform X2 n=1 Tax=Acropora muricata TaxID=159855 RepID=UPI0034E56303